MNEELKACPFCGGEAAVFFEYDELESYCGFVACRDCDMRTEGHILARKPLKELEPQVDITAWNTRPLEDELVTALEGLMNNSGADGDYDAGKYLAAKKVGRALIAKARS